MPSKRRLYRNNLTKKEQLPRTKSHNPESDTLTFDPNLIQQARLDPSVLKPEDISQLQRKIGNQEIDQLLIRSEIAQNVMSSDSVIQRRNGAKVSNWHTNAISTSDGFISHEVGWESNTGNLSDLDDVKTREEVSWDKGCKWAKDKFYYNDLAEGKGNVGKNVDTHQATQPYFDTNNPPKPGQKMTFTMNQVYQQSTDGGKIWNDIPGSRYSLNRTLYRRKWPFSNQYIFTLIKKGIEDTGVNHTVSVKFKL